MRRRAIGADPRLARPDGGVAWESVVDVGIDRSTRESIERHEWNVFFARGAGAGAADAAERVAAARDRSDDHAAHAIERTRGQGERVREVFRENARGARRGFGKRETRVGARGDGGGDAAGTGRGRATRERCARRLDRPTRSHGESAQGRRRRRRCALPAPSSGGLARQRVGRAPDGIVRRLDARLSLIARVARPRRRHERHVRVHVFTPARDVRG